jgi:hypothetical protein
MPARSGNISESEMLAGCLGRVSELARSATWRASLGQTKCRFANARPEPDFKYRSNRIAAGSLLNCIRHENPPRPVCDGLHILPCVMTRQPLFEIAREPHVVSGGSAFAPKHIYESFGSDFHTAPNATCDPT